MANEQWGFFIVPHLLWHGPTLYNGHFSEDLAVELAVTTCFNNLGLSQPGTGSNLDLPHARQIFFHEATAMVPAF